MRVLLLGLGLLLSACNAFGSSAPARIVVEWTTATEINTAGFNLYRGARAEGPFVKINAELIPASPDPLLGGKYRYEDTTVSPGQTYYYQLEDVEYGGASARHGPIVITAPGGIGTIETITVSLLALVIFGFAVWRFARVRGLPVRSNER